MKLRLRTFRFSLACVPFFVGLGCKGQSSEPEIDVAQSKKASETLARETQGPIEVEEDAEAEESRASDPYQLNDIAPPTDASKTAKGVVYSFLSKATERSEFRPSENEWLSFRWKGWTKSGELFDESPLDQPPRSLRVRHLLPGWQEIIPLLSPGDVLRFWVPEELSYKKGTEGKPKGDLIFQVDLIGFGGTGKSPE